MNDDHHGDEGVKVLHRMIIYIRDEAIRLRVTDVAFLLKQAEDAVVAFAPLIQADQGDSAFASLASTREH